jgi:hypothetical protein
MIEGLADAPARCRRRWVGGNRHVHRHEAHPLLGAGEVVAGILEPRLDDPLPAPDALLPGLGGRSSSWCRRRSPAS